MAGPFAEMHRGLAVLALLVAIGVSSACKENGDIEVSDFELAGVHAFSSSQLLNVLATRSSGWLPWSKKRRFDRAQFEADLKRIQAYYADRGYPDAHVTNVDVVVNDKRDAVSLHIDVVEGDPVIVDDVRFEGFEVVPERARSALGQTPLKAGATRDHDQVKATRDIASRILRDNGYPQSYVDAGERPSATPGHVIVTFRADPGPIMTFGDVAIDGLNKVGDDVVRREIGFKTGATFRDSQVARTQRRLSALEVFQIVSVTPRLEEAQGNQVPVRITVAEGPPRQLTFGLGYGSEERARATFGWRHVNFFGGARQAEIEAKLSFLDRGVKVTFGEPYLLRPGLSLNFSGIAWKTSQLTYDSETYGGRATVTYHTETRSVAARGPVRYNVRAAYVHEYLEYGIKADALNDLTSRDERIALGLDPTTGRGAGTLAAIDLDLERVAVDIPQDPTLGLITSLHVEHAAPWLLGSYRFDEVLAEARAFVPIGRVVLAAKGRVGSIAAADSSQVPFSKLYFLGGASSLRGWGRFQVSPLDQQGLPIGGRTLLELSAEARFPIWGKVSGVVFLDTGDVGASTWNLEGLHPRADVGPGLRYRTPIGVVRADFGFQINPIPGLFVNGAPETRHWRIHFSIGQAF